MAKTSIPEILSRWPSRKALADDIEKKVIVVHRWHQRESIPSVYDARLLDAAARRGIPLEARELADARSICDHVGHARRGKSTSAANKVNAQPEDAA